jgi:heat shock protein HtpX
MVYILLAINILANWGVVFILTALAWQMGNYPGDAVAVQVSGLITLGVVAVALSPIGERLTTWWRGTRKLNDKEKENSLPYFQEVCEKAQVKMPRIRVYRSKEFNAEAVGWNTVIINSVVLRKSGKEEIQGIFAHELGHLVHKDSIRLNIVNTLNFVGGWGTIIAVCLIGALTAMGRRIPILAPMLIIVLVLKAFQVAMEWIVGIGLLSVGRKQELQADDYAKGLGYGDGLITLLKRGCLGRTDHSFMSRILETHPPAIVRIRRIANPVAI